MKIDDELADWLDDAVAWWTPVGAPASWRGCVMSFHWIARAARIAER